MADDKSLDKYAERSQMKSETGSSSNSNSSSNTSSPRRGSNRESRGGYSRCQNRDRIVSEGQRPRRTSTPRDGAQASSSSSSEKPTEVGNSEEPTTSSQQNKKNKKVKKRVSPKSDLDIRPNDVFVNENTHFLAQLAKCQRLFDKGHREVFLHGLGKSIPRALNLAFELAKFYNNTVAYAVNTSTVDFVDDIVDLEDPEQPPSTTIQKISSVDIRVYRCVDIP